MNYLLDTYACIALINGTPAPVRNLMRKAIDGGGHLFTSSIVLFQL
jgi:predicted nucleic acid-binding protein